MTVRITPDIPRWRKDVRQTFLRFEQRLAGGVQNNVVGGAKRETQSVVRAGLTRPEYNRGHVGLAKAIEQSIHPLKGTIGAGIGHKPTLDSMAVYWHAIEKGSDHIIGHTLWGFIGPEGVFEPSQSRSGKDSTGLNRTQMSLAANKARPGVVQRPITPHNYLKTLGERASVRLHAEVHQRANEVFSGRRIAARR